jgi:hypothetical protein
MNGLVLTNTSRSRELAINLASQDVDHERVTALSSPSGIFSVTSTPSPQIFTIGGTQYSLKRTVDWVTTTGSSGACGTGSGTLAYKSVIDTVSWQQNGGSTLSASMTTLVAPISNINSDTAGTIIVAITGSAAGAPESGVTVSITPNTGGGGAALAQQPAATDSDGCSFGLNVQPGTYTVKATEANGIDFQQNAPAVDSTVTVAAGQNSMVNFTYDQAGKFTFSYPSGATLPTNMPLTFINDVGGDVPFANSPTSVSAFPFSDGYNVVAGTYVFATGGGPSTCIDTNPTTWPTDATTGAAAPTLATLTAQPGGTSDISPYAVPMGEVKVGGYTTGNFLTAVSTPGPSGTPDPGCLSGQTLTFPKTTSGSSTLALPFGTWTIYSGSTAGSKTTNLIKAKSTNVTVSGTGSVDGTSTYTVMLDPRVVAP